MDVIPPPQHATEVADRIFAFIQPDGGWNINNPGFVVGDDGVWLIDTCGKEHRNDALGRAVARETTVPVTTIVNTHEHPDHVNGNGCFGATTIIAHEGCREALRRPPFSFPPSVRAVGPMGAIDPAPPHVTFTDPISAWVGDLQLRLLPVGRPAHSDTDVLVWLPEPAVLFAGDIVMDWSMPLASRSLAGTLAALHTILELAPRVVVPGHGPVGDVAMVHRTIEFYELVGRSAEHALAQGWDPLRAARETDLGPFAAYSEHDRLVVNLHGAMAELSGARTTPKQVFDDAVAFNGGPLGDRS